MIQLGISAFYHDSAACLVVDGKVVAAAEEERFTGIKHDESFPINAINWILKSERLNLNSIDQICWYENPKIKRKRVLKTFNKHFFTTLPLRLKYLWNYKNQDPEYILKKVGYKGEIKYTDHHLSHAAFSYYTSPYKDAAVVTIDGVGEFETATISRVINNKVEKVISVDFPNSLGMLYSTITAYLGFKPNEGEYKVMGLAPYGDPTKYTEKLGSLISHTSNKFFINQKPFTWEYSDKEMFNKYLCYTLGILPRLPNEPITQVHKDLAASLQKVYEVEFQRLLNTAKNFTKSPNLCLGGGCAYNGVANVLAYKFFDSVHIPYAPSDAGSSIGACLYNYKGERKVNNSPYLGPEYKDTEVFNAIQKYDNIRAFRLADDLLIKKTAEILSKQNIVGWFQGKMEFGARALGNRSILAAPQNPHMREKLNHVIKKREGFRPFAPSVVEEKASQYFDIKENVPYMNIVCKAKTKKFPSATHIDGSARVQTVSKKQNEKYYLLLKEVSRYTGSPVLLNTSFNLKDQTITLSPDDAIKRFLDSKINFLVINNYLIQKK